MSDCQHEWEKDGLVTQVDDQGTYDRMKCTKCGMYGKRRGLPPETEAVSKDVEGL